MKDLTELTEQLFDFFKSLDIQNYTVKRAKKSNGIGLYIVKQLVDLNDGQIKAVYKNNNLIIEIFF